MNMPVTTTFTIEGHRITQYKGIARGTIVRSPTIAQGMLGGLKSIIGGRIGAYTEMCEQARQQAFDLIVEHAREMGGNAIVGLRYGRIRCCEQRLRHGSPLLRYGRSH